MSGLRRKSSASPGFIVVLAEDLKEAPEATRTLSATHNILPTRVYHHALRGFAARGPVPVGLAMDPRVLFVESDLPVRAFAQIIPTGVNRIGADRNPVARIDGNDQRVDADIAIVDTGVDLDHPDLNVYRNEDFSGTRPDGDDDHGHGTHVAGIAAAVDNDLGVVGVAPGARIWALKALDSEGAGYLSDVIKAIDYVTAHAAEVDVVNLSLGGQGSSQAFRLAIQNCVRAGVVVVAAAGNESADIYGPDGMFDTGDDFIPAAFPEVIAVSALADSDGHPGGLGPATAEGADDTLARFSNFSRTGGTELLVASPGKAIDLAAPGVDIYSTLPGGRYGKMTGSSMAAPHVAGAAALFIAANGKPADHNGVLAVRQALINSGQPQTQWGPVNTRDPDPNPEPLVQCAQADLPVLHIAGLRVGLRRRSQFWEGISSATVHNAYGRGITRALVSGDWTLNDRLLRRNPHGVTSRQGTARISSGLFAAKRGDVLAFKVTGISRSGYIYNPDANAVSEVSIIVK